jgi:ATP-dependent Lon protease
MQQKQKKWSKKEAPLLPLRNLVLFPSMTVPLIIGREKSINAVEKAFETDKYIVCTAQHSELIDEPTQDELYTIGVGCEIMQIQQKMPDGNLRIVIEGLQRVKITKFNDQEKLTTVNITPIIDKSEITPQITAMTRVLMEKFEEYIKINRRLVPELLFGLESINDPHLLVDVVSSHINISIQAKQQILATEKIQDRLDMIIEVLSKELEIMSLQNKIENEVKTKIDKSQKEFYLREQLRAIQKELGESNSEFSSEIGVFKKKLEERQSLPKHVVDAINEQLDKLEKMPPMAAEASVVRNYLDWLFDLPWETKTQDSIDIANSQKILDQDHYDLEEVKERILEFLAVRKLAPKVKSPILCLVGPPGVGKTSLGKSVARAMGRKFVRISLGGIKDEAEIRGHRRTYVGALPGRIIQGMKTAGSSNPVFLLDEIDKVGVDFRGDPTSALLEALDPEQNTTFSDHYLEIPYDLSEVLFITTANVTHTIPRALFDRMEVIFIPGYTEFDKVYISKNFLIPKQMESNGLKPEDIELTDAAISKIIKNYTREAGLRTLERKIASLMRKIAKKKVESLKWKKVSIDENDVETWLDIPVFKSEAHLKKDEIGVATGLAVTEMGGEVLFVETTVMEGNGKLILTGQLGDVMKESAQAALSYARSHAKEIGIDEDFKADKYDIHIHVPEGATPKDGPSAGVSITTSLVSALRKVPVRSDVAMTGEITLRGKVLPIGGVKEKVLAAHRYGIRKVLLPADNKPDVAKVPEQIRKEMTIVFVETIDEVLKEALK